MMNNWTALFIFALATWRVASLLVNEKGPFNIFLKIRSLAGIEKLQMNNSPEFYKIVPDTFLGNLLDCVWCCSIWTGLSWVLFYYLTPQVAVWFALPLAFSTLAISIETLLGRGS